MNEEERALQILTLRICEVLEYPGWFSERYDVLISKEPINVIRIKDWDTEREATLTVKWS